MLDTQEYAKLLNSVGQQGAKTSKRRPLTPIQCAEYIQKLVEAEPESKDKIAKRLSLGKPKNVTNMYKKRDTSQIQMFLNLLKLSSKSRQHAGWQYDGYPYIPFSTMAQLATMKNLTSQEQDMIIQSIHNSKNKKRVLGKEDIKKIKKWRNENPDLSIEECIKTVFDLKPVTTVNHIIIIEIHNSLQEFINSHDDYGEKILYMLRNNLPGEFYDITAGESAMSISMNEDAYKIFHEHQYMKKISYTKFFNKFLENKIE